MEKKSIIIPEQAQNKIKNFVLLKNNIENEMKIYIEGVCEGMGLKGSYSFDIGKMEAIKNVDNDSSNS